MAAGSGYLPDQPVTEQVIWGYFEGAGDFRWFLIFWTDTYSLLRSTPNIHKYIDSISISWLNTPIILSLGSGFQSNGAQVVDNSKMKFCRWQTIHTVSHPLDPCGHGIRKPWSSILQAGDFESPGRVYFESPRFRPQMAEGNEVYLSVPFQLMWEWFAQKRASSSGLACQRLDMNVYLVGKKWAHPPGICM